MGDLAAYNVAATSVGGVYVNKAWLNVESRSAFKVSVCVVSKGPLYGEDSPKKHKS